MDDYGFTVRFYCHCGEGWGSNGANNDSKETNVTLDVTLENAIERSVYQLIKEDATLTIPQLAERMSVNGRTVQRAISSLKEKGIIVRKGGKRYGHWEIIRNVQDE